jgi:hypothetical protein
LAFQAFFALLFSGKLSPELIAELGLATKSAAPAKQPPPPKANASDGALQILGIMQRDGRILDFLLEDITPYSDEQVGGAARGVHDQVKEALDRYFQFAPVIDGVEGSFTKVPAQDPTLVKFIGNVPAAPPAGGILRHRGWQVTQVNFPALPSGGNLKIMAPAELEVE